MDVKHLPVQKGELRQLLAPMKALGKSRMKNSKKNHCAADYAQIHNQRIYVLHKLKTLTKGVTGFCPFTSNLHCFARRIHSLRG